MNSVFTWIKLGCASVCGVAAYVFGGFDTILKILLIMCVIDYLTGVSAAIVHKNLSSKAGFNGILKKIAILCIVAVAHLLGGTLGLDQIRSAVIGFYIATEGISIMENAAALGVKMPKLIAILKQLKDREDEENDIQL